MSPLAHSVPLALSTPNGAGPTAALNASAALLWVDRTFAITAAHVLRGVLKRQKEEPDSRVWLGCLEIEDLESRILSLSDAHDLATLRVDPGELDCLGESAAFYSPSQWPPPPVEIGEEIHVSGYPRDQWPARIDFTFRVESATARRFGAVLLEVGMPGRLQGLSGAPAFRNQGSKVGFAGIVVDSLFHNEVVRAQHAYHIDPCGMLSAESDRA